MSSKLDPETGIEFKRKGTKDLRWSKETMGARTEPKYEGVDVSIWRVLPDEGRHHNLFMTREEAYILADLLDELLAYLESQEE